MDMAVKADFGLGCVCLHVTNGGSCSCLAVLPELLEKACPQQGAATAHSEMVQS